MKRANHSKRDGKGEKHRKKEERRGSEQGRIRLCVTEQQNQRWVEERQGEERTTIPLSLPPCAQAATEGSRQM